MYDQGHNQYMMREFYRKARLIHEFMNQHDMCDMISSLKISDSLIFSHILC